MDPLDRFADQILDNLLSAITPNYVISDPGVDHLAFDPDNFRCFQSVDPRLNRGR
jgi:hypothetical protein